VASPYLTAAVKFIACSFNRLASAWGTPMFYRRSLESILTWNSAPDKTRNFSTQTHNISCSLTTGGEAHGGRCHSELCSAPCGRSAVVLRPRTVSCQDDAAASIVAISTKCYRQRCQLPLSHGRLDIRGAAY
jgi:hypothetical protein